MRTALIALAVVLLFGACSNDTREAAPIPADDPAFTTVPPQYAATVDWPARTSDIPAVGGLDIAFCDGDAPLLCVNIGDDVQGVIEHVNRPGEGKDLVQGAEAWTAKFFASITADRRKACDASYELTPEPTRDVTVAGQPGFRYSYSGAVGGEPMERVIGFGVVIGADLHLIVTNALADNACLFRESELSLPVARKIEPILGAIAAGSSF